MEFCYAINWKKQQQNIEKIQHVNTDSVMHVVYHGMPYGIMETWNYVVSSIPNNNT